MHIDTNELYDSIVESFEKMVYIKPEEIPNIDLYMDQVTTFMDSHLRATERGESDEKVMTKTMINNYAKNDVIPAPVKKKYSKEHLYVLIFLYYFKSILQINDIKALLGPIISEHFGGDKDYSIEDVYKEIFAEKKEQIQKISEDVFSEYEDAMKSFGDAPDNDRDYLRTFDFVCKLACDVFVRKLLIEKIVDGLKAQSEETKEKTKEKDQA